MGRLADRRVIYEFIDLCRERHDGYAIADDPGARAELVELYIEAEITRLFALRNHWLAHSNQPRSYEGAQYSLRRKLSGLDIAEKMLRIAGPTVLTKDKRWGPLNGTIEYFQRDAITALHPGATTDIQRVIIARRLGMAVASGRKPGRCGDVAPKQNRTSSWRGQDPFSNALQRQTGFRTRPVASSRMTTDRTVRAEPGEA